jgi:hypothetical protein
MSWFCVNVSAALVFFGLWTGIPMWLAGTWQVCDRARLRRPRLAPLTGAGS